MTFLWQKLVLLISYCLKKFRTSKFSNNYDYHTKVIKTRAFLVFENKLKTIKVKLL